MPGGLFGGQEVWAQHHLNNSNKNRVENKKEILAGRFLLLLLSSGAISKWQGSGLLQLTKCQSNGSKAFCYQPLISSYRTELMWIN